MLDWSDPERAEKLIDAVPPLTESRRLRRRNARSARHGVCRRAPRCGRRSASSRGCRPSPSTATLSAVAGGALCAGLFALSARPIRGGQRRAQSHRHGIDHHGHRALPRVDPARQHLARPWARPRPHCRIWKGAWISRTTCTTMCAACTRCSGWRTSTPTPAISIVPPNSWRAPGAWRRSSATRRRWRRSTAAFRDIEDERGDRVAERRASLSSLEHAKRSGSTKWLAHALVNLGDSYLEDA